MQTADSAGSELLIFVPRDAHSHDLSFRHSLQNGHCVGMGIVASQWLRVMERDFTLAPLSSRLGRPEAFLLETHLPKNHGPRPGLGLRRQFNVSPMTPSFGDVGLASRSHHD